MTTPVLAIDCGGTRIKCGVIADGRLLATETLPAHSDEGLAAALPRIEEALRRCCSKAQVQSTDCGGIACAVPALVDHERQRVRNAYGKYDDAPGVDLPGWARQAFGLPLRIENDARLALIGEWRHGAGQGHDDLVLITLGTGVGTAVLSAGNVLRGADGRAGNLGGHLAAVPGGRPCSCGAQGCYESETGSLHLGEIVRGRLDYAISALVREPRIDYGVLCRLAAAGDRCATAALDRSARLWARLCCDLAACYGCRHVVVGGGVIVGNERLLNLLRAAVAEHEAASTHASTPALTVFPASDGEHMALLGAEWLLSEAQPQPTLESETHACPPQIQL